MSKSNEDEVKFIAKSLRNLDKIAEAFEKMLPAIATLAMAHDVSLEMLQEIPEWMDRMDGRIEKVERAIVLQGADQQRARIRSITNELRSEMFDGLVENLKQRLKICIQERNQLLEHSARHGGEVPFRITQRLIEVNESIAELRKEIENLMDMENG